ncbi:hypothetical protein C8Q79DRAFT_914071, partial [Trametes meyenii]
ICTHLTPQDVLSLYRTNKALYAKLGNMSGTHEWKEARKNIEGLLPCLTWLTEPQFASLCFDSHCQICLRPNLESRCFLWHLNARYCDACLSDQSVQ